MRLLRCHDGCQADAQLMRASGLPALQRGLGSGHRPARPGHRRLLQVSGRHVRLREQHRDADRPLAEWMHGWVQHSRAALLSMAGILMAPGVTRRFS
jgi:hypothetical protein